MTRTRDLTSQERTQAASALAEVLDEIDHGDLEAKPAERAYIAGAAAALSVERAG